MTPKSNSKYYGKLAVTLSAFIILTTQTAIAAGSMVVKIRYADNEIKTFSIAAQPQKAQRGAVELYRAWN
jgi:hypothetical protein